MFAPKKEKKQCCVIQFYFGICQELYKAHLLMPSGKSKTYNCLTCMSLRGYTTHPTGSIHPFKHEQKTWQCLSQKNYLHLFSPLLKILDFWGHVRYLELQKGRMKFQLPLLNPLNHIAHKMMI